MKVSKYFYIQEFVPQEIYNQFGEKSIWFIDKRLFSICDYLRELTNEPITINNWHLQGGKRQESGYRIPNSQTGGKLSQHKRGAAVDVLVHNMNPVQVYNLIQEHKKEFMSLGLTTMENVDFTPTWNHLDTRNTGPEYENDILIVNP